MDYSHRQIKKIKKSPNIIDVAKKAGVSQGTVSNHLNKTAPVSIKTAELIEEAIKDLRYIPDKIASGLRKGKIQSVGIIFPEISDPYYSLIVDGIEDIASKNTFSTIIACNNYDLSKEKEQVDNILGNNISGIIFCCGGMDEELVKKVKDHKVPFVFVDRKITDKDIYSVGVDNFLSYYNAGIYLTSRGHKNIYYLTEPLVTGVLSDRINGFKKALHENFVNFDERKIIEDKSLQKDRPYGGYKIMKKLLNSGIRPDAVIASADSIVYGAMKAAIDNGLKIPKDISFMGNNDSYISEFVNPSLTSIRQPSKEMGRTAMEILLKLMSGDYPANNKIILKTSIVKRSSVNDRR